MESNDWISLGSLAVALSALAFSLKLSLNESRLQRKQQLRALHIEVLKIGLENPDFLQHEVGTIGSMDEVQSKRYSMYVYLLLNHASLAFDEGMPDEEWKSLLDKYISVHRDFLVSMDVDIKKTFSTPLRNYLNMKLPNSGWA